VPIEELFSSRGRIKILKELASSNELNISELCRRVSLNHSSTKSHLEVLIESGLVEEKMFGRIKIYRYRVEDLKARSLKNLFDLWDS
jgi:DNA-binding transcriptional ArsR family regulator